MDHDEETSSHKKLPSKLVLDTMASPEHESYSKSESSRSAVSDALSALDSLSGAFDFGDDDADDDDAAAMDVLDPDNSFGSGVTSDGEDVPLHERLGRLHQVR